MARITLWIWLALAGCVLQLIALVGFDFYVHEDGKREDPFFGIPHTSDLIVLSAVVAVGLFVATALGRNPIRGRSVGLVVGGGGAAGYRAARLPDDRAALQRLHRDVRVDPRRRLLLLLPAFRGPANESPGRDLDRLCRVPGGYSRRVSPRF